jgi:hypothetical protein
MDQLQLFEYDEPPVPKPKRRAPPGEVTWIEIANKRGIKCEYCMSLYTEMEFPPTARIAKHKRVVDGMDTLLCNAHKEVEVAAEKLERARDDRDQFSRRKSRR